MSELLPTHPRRKKGWCFTINNPDGSLVGDELKRWMAGLTLPETTKIAYAVWSLEEGETGTPHIQGYVRFTNKLVFNTVRRILSERAHVEGSNGSDQANYEYISHTGKHANKPGLLDGPYELGSRNIEGKRDQLLVFREAVQHVRKFDELYEDPSIASVLARYPQYALKMFTLERNKKIKTVEIDKLYCWQWGILYYLKQGWQTRRIYWIWSERSGTGKSSFGQFLCSRYDVLIASGEYKDILYAYQDQEVIWFDLARADQLNGNLTSTLELLSNGGRQMSTKYQACQKIVQAHIIVTSNKAPPTDVLPNRLVSIEAHTEICGQEYNHIHGENIVDNEPEPEDFLTCYSPIDYDRSMGHIGDM